MANLLPEIEPLFDNIKQLTTEVVANVAARADSSRNNHASSEERSPLEIINHLAVVGDQIIAYTENKVPTLPLAKPTKFSMTLEIAVLMHKIGIPMPTPPEMEPKAMEPLTDLADRLYRQNEKLETRLETVTVQTLKLPFARHLKLGFLNADQLLRLHESHLIYHRNQLLRVPELKVR